ncbi:PAS domain-containing protein [Streptomyces albireticuli]|uniref:response regulator n=1 Tax=Streptomyces albireticuli TaxID=1940 RepID=UPI000B43EB25|nr:PAS domain-containing protein [Streptomyces albireticuli]
MSSRPSRGAARLAAILDALPDALLLVNCNGTVVNANHIALETFEVPGTGLVGRGLLSLLPDFDSRRIPGSMRLPDNADNRTKPTRMVARRTDGSQFPVEVTSANLEDGRTPYADHQPYTGDELLMLVVRDLTGTLDTEAELARQQRQTEMILRAAAEGVVGVDTDGKVVLVNPSAAQILGYRASDLGGKELHPLIHHSRPDGTPFPFDESPIADTLRSGRKHRVRGQVLWAKDGRAVPVDLTTAPVRDGDQLVGAVMTFTDRRAHDALAARHAQLLAVLESSLRGPLEQLRAELGTLAADPAGQLWPEANQILHHLSAGYARMTTLVDNVLAYQQLDAGEAKLARESVSLDEVVAAGVEGAVELIGPGRAQFAVHAPPIEAEVDPERFAQALAHLIADVAGVDATGSAPAGAAAPAGDRTIVVAAAQRGEVVRVEVRGPYAGGDPVHAPIVRGIVRGHGGVLQTHDLPGAAGGHAYVLEVPVSAKAGPVSASATAERSATDTMNATTVMPVPSQRARGTESAAAPGGGDAAGKGSGGDGGDGPAGGGSGDGGTSGGGTAGGGRRAKRGAAGEAVPVAPAAPASPAEAAGRPQSPSPSQQQSPPQPQPTGRRRARPRTDEERPADVSGLVPPQGTAAPTGRRARRDQPRDQVAEAPRAAFALPPAEADRTPGSVPPGESVPAAAPSGRRARRSLAEAERPIPGQASAEPAAPRAVFALPPAAADRTPGSDAPSATALPSTEAPGPDAPAPKPAPGARAGDALAARVSQGAAAPYGGVPPQNRPERPGGEAAPGPYGTEPSGTGPDGAQGGAGQGPYAVGAADRPGAGGVPPRPGQVPQGPFGTDHPGAGPDGAPTGAGQGPYPAGTPERPGGGPAAPRAGQGPYATGSASHPGDGATPPRPGQAPQGPFGTDHPGTGPNGSAPQAGPDAYPANHPGAGPDAPRPGRGTPGPYGAENPDVDPNGPTSQTGPSAYPADPDGSPAAPRPGQGPFGTGVPGARPNGPAPQAGPDAYAADPANHPGGGTTPPRPGQAPQGPYSADAPAAGPFGAEAMGAGPNGPVPPAGRVPGAAGPGPFGAEGPAGDMPGRPGTVPHPGLGGPVPRPADGDGPATGPVPQPGAAPAPNLPGRPGAAPGAGPFGPDAAAPGTVPHPGLGGPVPQPTAAPADGTGPVPADAAARPEGGVQVPRPAPGVPFAPPYPQQAPEGRAGGGPAGQDGPGPHPQGADASGEAPGRAGALPGAPAPFGTPHPQEADGPGRSERPETTPGADAPPQADAPTGRRRARRALAEEPGAAPQADKARQISVRTLGQGPGAGDTPPGGTPVGSGRRRKLGNPAEGEREARTTQPSAARPQPLGGPEGRAFAIGAPDEGSEGPEPLDGPNGAVEVMNAPRPPMDDELPPEPLDNPRRLLVWPAPDDSTRQALTERGYRPVIVHSREEVDAQIAAYPAALFVDPLTGPITRTALQSLRQAAVAAEVPVLVTAGLGQAAREAAYGADPAVLLKALAPRDSEMHPPRVLLIEEHEPIALALTATLERRGMQVARAATDAEAVTLAAQLRPNLVVMDLMQVRRRRAGIVDWLRGNGLLARTPLVVYTSPEADPAQLALLAAGETVLFLAERSTSTEVQGRIVDLLSKIGTG